MLLEQLPSSARVFRVDNPDLEWETEAQILRLIEYNTRCILYALGNGKGKKPRPIETPSETKRKQHALNSAVEHEQEIADILADILPRAQMNEGGDE